MPLRRSGHSQASRRRNVMRPKQSIFAVLMAGPHRSCHAQSMRLGRALGGLCMTLCAGT